jgi:hypothetical protein
MNANLTSVKRRLAENYRRVRDRVQEACDKARRRPSDVTIVAVTKEVEIDIIRQALEMGLTDLGESRGQQLNQRAAMLHEFVTRRQRLGGTTERPGPRPRWHMIGHLQRNKVKLILPWVEVIHSVDSLRLAEEIEKTAERLGRPVEALLQVNTSGERSKSGVAVGAVPHVAEHLAPMKHVRLRGLMTMAPIDAAPDDVRLYFDRLREVFEDVRAEGVVGREFDQLSMGMSRDYPIAIEAGATMVRLGHALFEGLTSGVPAAAESES